MLILTTFGLDTYVYDALRAGASGFMLKDAPPEEIAAAVQIVARGEALLAPAVTRAVIEEFARQRPHRARAATAGLEELTPREQEVLELLARGLSNPEICQQLVDQRGDREDARRPRPPEARSTRPRPGRDLRLRNRPRHAGFASLSEEPGIVLQAGGLLPGYEPSARSFRGVGPARLRGTPAR